MELLEVQARDRVPELVPIRYGRMMVSPFAFYRGAAAVMASDLARIPDSGLQVQLCGDAHMSNFGAFASPERHLVFDVNDFDETAPGPFDWDLKRLVASLEIAGRENGFTAKERRAVVTSAAGEYRKGMAAFASQSNLEVWYAHLDVDQAVAAIKPRLKKSTSQRADSRLAKVRTRDSMQAFKKLTTVRDGEPRIVSDPPLVVPITEMLAGHDATDLFAQLRELLSAYTDTLQADRKHLVQQYRLVDVARKVVGVGSVGTRAWILLLEGIDGRDPLFLQAKEAQVSVLEAFTGPSSYANHGQRVVAGQRLLQASSDIFLGWNRTVGDDGIERDYYIRQLRDWKGSAVPEEMNSREMTIYARICGWTLARGHARSGDRVGIASYIGSKDRFDEALADFATAYADQNDRDYAALHEAAGARRIEAAAGL